jgi:hypothetical protein
MKPYAGWKHAKADIFWGELAFYDHLIQVYETDEVMIETLTGFVETGLDLGDCSVVFVTPPHMAALNDKLKSRGIDVDNVIAEDRYIPIDAEETLSKFMVNDSLDEVLFKQTMAPIFDRCRSTQRVVRAGGEMVALLAAQGNWDATIQLERLWEEIHEKKPFSICCLYPKGIVDGGVKTSVALICAKHSKMISGSEKQITKVCYRDEVIV